MEAGVKMFLMCMLVRAYYPGSVLGPLIVVTSRSTAPSGGVAERPCLAGLFVL